MNTVREYRMPLLIGAGALVVALLLYAILVSPQASKLSSLQSQQTQLQAQADGAAGQTLALKTEKQNLTKSCADLEKIATQIPSVQSPTDVDAEESSFESQFNGSGRDLRRDTDPVQWVRSRLDRLCRSTPRQSGNKSPAGVVAVPTTLTVTGDYGQDDVIHQRTGQLPSAVRDPDLRLGLRAPTSSSQRAVGSRSRPHRSGSGSIARLQRHRPVGRRHARPHRTAGPYSLSITGSIYYTSTPNALSACTKATASVIRSLRGEPSQSTHSRPAAQWSLSDPADLHVADGQGLAGGDAGEPFDVGSHRHQ